MVISLLTFRFSVSRHHPLPTDLSIFDSLSSFFSDNSVRILSVYRRLKAQAAKPIMSPVPESLYPTLAFFMLTFGLIVTASFFM